MPSTSKSVLVILISSLYAFTNAQAVNCPGVLHADDNIGSSCCVGGTLYLSTCPGWPICTGAATTTTGPLSCATDIPVTVDNYDALIASASSSLRASGTQYLTTITGAGSQVSGGDAVGGGDDSSTEATSRAVATTIASPTQTSASVAASTSSAAAATASSQSSGMSLRDGTAVAVALSIAASLSNIILNAMGFRQ